MRPVAEYDGPLNFTVERKSKSVAKRCRTMPSPLLTLAAKIEPRHLEELAFVIFGGQISLGLGRVWICYCTDARWIRRGASYNEGAIFVARRSAVVILSVRRRGASCNEGNRAKTLLCRQGSCGKFFQWRWINVRPSQSITVQVRLPR